jgi:protoporphyrinogen oxidase
MRVAVIGMGIAGNAAAWTLSKRYPIAVYDRELRPGGHSHTVTIDYDGRPVAVDIGSIVYNELNCPDLAALLLPSPQVLKSLGERFGVPVIRERIFGEDYARTLAIWRSNFRAA